MIDAGYLPTWNDVNNASTQDEMERLTAIIENFLKYHFQSNSIVINGIEKNKRGTNIAYESSLLNNSTKRFYSVTTNTTSNSMTVKDLCGTTANVLTNTPEHYNRMATELWIQGTQGTSSATVQSTSYAVVHFIDNVLLYSNSQKQPWQ